MVSQCKDSGFGKFVEVPFRPSVGAEGWAGDLLSLCGSKPPPVSEQSRMGGSLERGSGGEGRSRAQET